VMIVRCHERVPFVRVTSFAAQTLDAALSAAVQAQMPSQLTLLDLRCERRASV
jgi:hypothetical protein